MVQTSSELLRLARSKGMLSNEKFLSKAPAEKIAEEKEKQQKYEQTYAQITERLKSLQGTAG